MVEFQVLSFGMIVSSALMIWKGLMVVTGSESPIVVVLSGSMEPAFQVRFFKRFWFFTSSFLQRGDLLFLTNYEEEDIRVGEIVVFKIDGRDIPIVHRCDPILETLIPLFVQSVEAAREGGRVDQVPHKGGKQHNTFLSTLISTTCF